MPMWKDFASKAAMGSHMPYGVVICTFICITTFVGQESDETLMRNDCKGCWLHMNIRMQT